MNAPHYPHGILSILDWTSSLTIGPKHYVIIRFLPSQSKSNVDQISLFYFILFNFYHFVFVLLSAGVATRTAKTLRVESSVVYLYEPLSRWPDTRDFAPSSTVITLQYTGIEVENPQRFGQLRFWLLQRAPFRSRENTQVSGYNHTLGQSALQAQHKRSLCSPPGFSVQECTTRMCWTLASIKMIYRSSNGHKPYFR